jgi:protein-S-isoprenylcysteine O-methyltransferase Ste14
MTPTLAKAAFVLLMLGWSVIRFPHARRASLTPVARRTRDPREIALMLVSATGLGVLPLLFVSTRWFRVADYSFHPVQAGFGVVVALISLAGFYLTHRALGRNWSVSLDVREHHTLVTRGVYGRVRHPMYTAFWLWAVAQALLLPNWIGGMAGLVGFGILFAGRVAREERMMVESFGDDYRAYMGRTYRVIPGIY